MEMNEGSWKFATLLYVCVLLFVLRGKFMSEWWRFYREKKQREKECTCCDWV